jgi:hypothetical protein
MDRGICLITNKKNNKTEIEICLEYLKTCKYEYNNVIPQTALEYVDEVISEFGMARYICIWPLEYIDLSPLIQIDKLSIYNYSVGPIINTDTFNCFSIVLKSLHMHMMEYDIYTLDYLSPYLEEIQLHDSPNINILLSNIPSTLKNIITIHTYKHYYAESQHCNIPYYCKIKFIPPS